MPLDVTGQAGWGGGIYRGRSAPPESVYDAVNALVDDAGNLFRRGGCAYKSNSDIADLSNLADVYVLAGRRTLAWTRAPATYALGADDATLGAVMGMGGSVLAPDSRPVVVRGELIGLDGASPGGVVRWAGSRKTANYGTGSVSVAVGDAVVTGSGTSWLTNADAGMYFSVSNFPSAGSGSGIVKSIDSDTQLTLADPFTAFTGSAKTYVLERNGGGNPISFLGLPPAIKYTVAAVAGRLVMTADSRAYVTGATDFTFLPDLFIDLQDGSNIIGSDSIQDALVLFTTAGVWVVSNMAFDDVDGAGNVQWQQQQVTKDLILWDDLGIAAWSGALIVPGVEDVVVLALDGQTQPLTESIRPLYRGYVAAGYRPGTATVHRGHYHLPILNGNTLVDELVCRLDREGTPWTRWADQSACVAYAQRVGASTRSPKLLGVSGQRIVDLTGCMSPSAANSLEADGTAHAFAITTRDYPTSGTNHPGTVARVRLRYELVEADGAEPQLLLGWTSDKEGDVFAPLNDSGQEGGDIGGGVPSAGDLYSWWFVGKQRERIRFRIFTAGEAASFVLRTLELLVRPSGLR